MRFSEKNIPDDITDAVGKKCFIIYIDRFNPGQYKYCNHVNMKRIENKDPACTFK